MTEKFEIAGYCRISVDDELDRDNILFEFFVCNINQNL